jgi:hypothetical protein
MQKASNGGQMTVCIAAICEHGRALIMAADRQFGLSFTSVESKHGKLNSFGTNWCVAFSASNSAHAYEAITLARSKLVNKPDRDHYDIVPEVVRCYQQVRNSKAENAWAWGQCLAALRALAKSNDPRRYTLVERHIDESLRIGPFSLAHALSGSAERSATKKSKGAKASIGA